MPRFLDTLCAIDWQYWYYEHVPIKVGFPEMELGWYFFTCRLVCWGAIATMACGAAAFAALGWHRWIGPLVLWDSGDR